MNDLFVVFRHLYKPLGSELKATGSSLGRVLLCTCFCCSWELYWASVEYKNWYCSEVWIIPPLQMSRPQLLNMQLHVKDGLQRKERGKHPPVESKLTNCLQDISLPGFSELLTADSAGYKTACPPDTCTVEGRTGEMLGEQQCRFRMSIVFIRLIHLSHQHKEQNLDQSNNNQSF